MQGWELFVEQPKTAMMRIEVHEGCLFSYYRDYLRPPPDPVTHSGTRNVLAVIGETGRGRRDAIIGYGTVPVSELRGVAEGVWIDLSTGGGRVKVDVQFSEFVDPQLR